MFLNIQNDRMDPGQKSLIPGETGKCNLLKSTTERNYKVETFNLHQILRILLPHSFQPSGALTSR